MSSSCFGSHPEDQYYERMLDKYLDQEDVRDAWTDEEEFAREDYWQEIEEEE